MIFSAPFIAALFAVNRGTLLRRINYHVLTASFNTVSLLVFSLLTNSIDDVINFTLVDGDQQLLVSNLVFLVFGIASVVSITYQLGEDTVDARYHVFMVLIAQASWVLAAKSTDHVFFWSYQALMTTFLLFVHLLLESRNSECKNPAYGNALLCNFFVYFFVFYLFTALGPWFWDIISMAAQRAVLMVADLAFIAFVLFNIMHYGGEAFIANNFKMQPGIAQRKNSTELTHLEYILHTY